MVKSASKKARRQSEASRGSTNCQNHLAIGFVSCETPSTPAGPGIWASIENGLPGGRNDCQPDPPPIAIPLRGRENLCNTRVYARKCPSRNQSKFLAVPKTPHHRGIKFFCNTRMRRCQLSLLLLSERFSGR